MSTMDQAAYAYAVARPFPAERLDGLRGVGGYPVRLVEHDDLVVAVSPVPLHEFDEQALKARLEDMDWLEAIARAHHSVVDAVGQAGAVVPLRLATVYHGEERAREALREEGWRFRAVLDRLTGRHEWGVKIYADPSAMPAPEQRPRPGAGSGGGAESPGKAYLRRRQEQRRSRDDTWRTATALVRRVEESLADLADACQQHRPQDAKLSGEPGENVLNAAYLVPDSGARRFLEVVEALRANAPTGTRIEVSGPWAPYSFTAIAEEAATAAAAHGGTG
ncbi:GvpL/GvpF family gas vesicle protein [Marinactinospora thermotolerans]|uniref:Gas vesicle synthesis protein GvpL/GvpF n=1 Tax=Marinactinospora thermotolerans DSM 45154 TaxID=1122192 RepID=A0A1T4P2Z2_9ACTN|nr:GvpL/GvpF family gas vesicle protein [Marinactinospora thermotolerans]SJZ85646.1 Gas vesicle synthesis protein GvpL/GvpF [Marinactinospora thermotolerans DSM 45154]